MIRLSRQRQSWARKCVCKRERSWLSEWEKRGRDEPVGQLNGIILVQQILESLHESILVVVHLGSQVRLVIELAERKLV